MNPLFCLGDILSDFRHLFNLDIRRLRYNQIDIDAKSYSIASKIVRTKMCDADVRLVIIRKRRKASKPYQYFCVFTTDLTLEIPQAVSSFFAKFKEKTNSQNIKVSFQDDTVLPFDEAA